MSTAMPAWERGALRAWSDPRFGPLGIVTRTRPGAPEPDWWHSRCTIARVPVGNPFSPEPLLSAGASIEAGEALRRALGEGIERYSGLTAIVRGEPATLRETGLADRLPRCAPDEPCMPSLRDLPLDTPLTHVRARRLDDDREVLVPAGCAHLHFAPAPPEPPVTLPISTGLAFGRDLPGAIWAGLCEVAERDAIMMMWWTRSRLPEIDCAGAGVPAALADRLARLDAAGLRARLFDMTTEFRVPGVFAVLTGARSPWLVVGAACHADPGRACAKALDEVVGLRDGLRAARPGDPAPLLPGDVRRLADHARFYVDAPQHPAFAFLLDGPREAVPFAVFARGPWWIAPADPAALARFAAERAAEGLTILWIDLTAPEAGAFGAVAKVIVPEMVPLSPDHAIRWLATPRLLRRAGLTTARAAAFNPFPHPFP
jgi:ribosomal protein S12 methylthiotransferase accessory factor